ncbi:MAG: P1 family peptidase [Caldilineaceae bacterium]|jgi:L-aminopeptidase/D-esterase-like protein
MASLTQLPSFRVGHWTDVEAATGCTVILCPEGATAGVDVRGGAPGTREIALLSPTCMVDKVHAVLLSGGSAFGLAAADGVMRWLEEHGYGFDTGVARVPIVPAAILFDLPLGSAEIRPGPDAGYAACEDATGDPAEEATVEEGTVGAGTGATVGKVLGFQQAMKGGIGVASQTLGLSAAEDDAGGAGITVAAVVAVNALGDVVDPHSGEVLAGARQPGDNVFVGASNVLKGAVLHALQEWRGGNTTLGVVLTNAALTKSGATKVAQMAHDGLARTVRPAHTMQDGDTIFALSRGETPVDPGIIGAIAADVVAEAVVRAVRTASSLHGIPAMSSLTTE